MFQPETDACIYLEEFSGWDLLPFGDIPRWGASLIRELCRMLMFIAEATIATQGYPAWPSLACSDDKKW